MGHRGVSLTRKRNRHDVKRSQEGLGGVRSREEGEGPKVPRFLNRFAHR